MLAVWAECWPVWRLQELPSETAAVAAAAVVVAVVLGAVAVAVVVAGLEVDVVGAAVVDAVVVTVVVEVVVVVVVAVVEVVWSALYLVQKNVAGHFRFLQASARWFAGAVAAAAVDSE